MHNEETFNNQSHSLQTKTAVKILYTNIEKKITIEDIFKSKGRIRILKILAHEGELNISAIVRKANLNHKSTINHLKFLMQANLVEKKTFGRIQIYRFKIENPKACKIRDFLVLSDKWTF